ncbi:hypothetical protein [Mesorhizobium huakuii]|uniref:Uncharacterized protein n=1 Tax=Mesorhizobium huakuii TaxID=28104 RepID=A0ABZ0VFJ7_9HYPH|nr:hypothetical protein [Mesorhizobium huakuii]WQB96232.1 hypothetical protein U0R22_000284 [Mesorhizobium huakuii]
MHKAALAAANSDCAMSMARCSLLIAMAIAGLILVLGPCVGILP